MIKAVQHVRRMRGGAQSHMMRCDDGGYYVVKFQNNPQARRVLANEWMASRLAAHIGLPVPETRIVEVSDWLVANSQDLRIQYSGISETPTAGLQFGARLVVDPLEGQCFDYLPESMLDRVRNVKDFAGILCLDKWTCNSDGRQVVFSKQGRERKYHATFIDQGYCFNAAEWSFPDSPLRGIYARNEVYANVTGWHSFEPWLSRIEALDSIDILRCVEGMPFEWYEDTDALDRLVDNLYQRRAQVRQLVAAFRDSSRNPFPNWNETGSLPRRGRTTVTGKPYLYA